MVIFLFEISVLKDAERLRITTG